MSEFLRKRNGLCSFYGTRGKELDLALYSQGLALVLQLQANHFFCTAVYPSVKLD